MAGLATSVALADDPPEQGKPDDSTTSGATTTATASSHASKPLAKNFIAKLRGANEVPPVTSDGLGISKLRVHTGASSTGP